MRVMGWRAGLVVAVAVVIIGLAVIVVESWTGITGAALSAAGWASWAWSAATSSPALAGFVLFMFALLSKGAVRMWIGGIALTYVMLILMSGEIADNLPAWWAVIIAIAAFAPIR